MNILHLEDNDDDAALIFEALRDEVIERAAWRLKKALRCLFERSDLWAVSTHPQVLLLGLLRLDACSGSA